MLRPRHRFEPLPLQASKGSTRVVRLNQWMGKCHDSSRTRTLAPLRGASVLPSTLPLGAAADGPSWGRATLSTSAWLPEFMQNVSIWGGSGFLLKTFHGPDGTLVPYWAGFALISVLVRLALVPLVVQGAHASARFAKVVPEVQFLLTLFGNDMRQMRHDKAPLTHRAALIRTNFQSLSAIYKLHNIHPFAVFRSPLLQLPIFWYISVDLRKIVHGLDPLLAQDLVEGGIGWVPDLTEPDPWFGLPVLAGLALYWNVEVAVGKRSLSGPAAAKSDTGAFLKDLFQSVAIFMPCFTSQLPAGVQIYIVTSFAFTLAQGSALRTEAVRRHLGLPGLGAPPAEAKYAKEFIDLMNLEGEARKIRGSGPILGRHGVLAPHMEASFPGQYRPSTIQGSGILSGVVEEVVAEEDAVARAASATRVHPALSWRPQGASPSSGSTPPATSFVHGISAPPWQRLAEEEEQKMEVEEEDPPGLSRATPAEDGPSPADAREYLPDHSDEVMDKANRGVRPVATRFVGASTSSPSSSSSGPVRLNVNSLRKGKGRKGRKRG